MLCKPNFLPSHRLLGQPSHQSWRKYGTPKVAPPHLPTQAQAYASATPGLRLTAPPHLPTQALRFASNTPS